MTGASCGVCWGEVVWGSGGPLRLQPVFAKASAGAAPSPAEAREETGGGLMGDGAGGLRVCFSRCPHYAYFLLAR